MTSPVPDRFDALIVGSGHAGASAAIALRKEGFVGTIGMISRDRNLPYERPPLSKDYLAGQKPFDRILLRPETFWQEREIDFVSGYEVTALEASEKRVTLGNGSQVDYRWLIWAAGGDPRALTCPGGSLEGVHYIRTREDADQIRERLDEGVRNAVVIGGGYVGLEASAVLGQLGINVTLLEAEERLLARVAGQFIGDFYQATHASHGVDVRLSSRVSAIKGEAGKVLAVEVNDREKIDADLVIVGIGVSPVVAPLLEAGARGANGVEVDKYCRTSLPDVYAIGDCAAHENRFARGARIRIESVQNASDMAACSARSICGHASEYDATPWFWSNQFDLKLQTVGLSQGYDEEVLRGDPQEGSFTVAYFSDGKVLALDCVNNAKDFVQGRKLVESRSQVDSDAFRNPEVRLKDLGEQA